MPECLYCHLVLLLNGGVPPDVSCINDVEDVLALELEESVDNPGTTIGTKFSVLHWLFQPFWLQMWFLTTSPLKGRDCRRVLEDLYRHEELKIVDENCCFLTRMHFPLAVITVVGFLETRMVFGSAEF